MNSLFQDIVLISLRIKVFANSLPSEHDRVIFMKMLKEYYKYNKAINANGQTFPTEPLLMTTLLSQYKLIECIKDQIYNSNFVFNYILNLASRPYLSNNHITNIVNSTTGI